MKVSLVHERSTSNFEVYSAKDFGSLIVTVHVPKGLKREMSYDLDLPDELVEGKTS